MTDNPVLMERNRQRAQILCEVLTHVPFEGWQNHLIEKAAQDVCGEGSLSWRLFPEGASDAIAYWSLSLDQQAVARLQELSPERVRDRIYWGVRYRLEALISDKEAARKTALYLAKKPLLGQKLAFETVSSLWYAAGDTSTDYNYYTKRALLLAVYASTFARFLEDASDDHAKTWSFLKARIDNVLTLPQLPKKGAAFLKDLKGRATEIVGALRP